MGEELYAVALLGAFGLTVLAVSIGAWFCPRDVPGSALLRIGSIVVDAGVILVFLASIYLKASWHYEYYNETAPPLTQEEAISISLAVVAAGMATFGFGFAKTRKARPTVPPQARRHVPGPPPR